MKKTYTTKQICEFLDIPYSEGKVLSITPGVDSQFYFSIVDRKDFANDIMALLKTAVQSTSALKEMFDASFSTYMIDQCLSGSYDLSKMPLTSYLYMNANTPYYSSNSSKCLLTYTKQSEHKIDIFFEFFGSGVDHGFSEDNVTMRIAELEIIDKITPEKNSLSDIAPHYYCGKLNPLI